MSNHTPGPWKVVDGHYPCMKEISGPSFRINIVMSATDIDFNDAVKRDADARLIAAAPELLSILKTLCALDESEVFVKRPWEETFAEARAAIAKATGENT